MQEFRLRVQDRTYKIGLDSDHLEVEGFGLNWQVLEAEGNRFLVAIDGIFYEVELGEDEDGQMIALVEGIQFPVEAIGLVRGRPTLEAEARPSAAVAPEAVEGALAAMMPSKVIAVPVQEGDRVEAEQVVLILEAMKMESELKSPHAGIVAAVNCAVGDSVDPGIPLVVIEPNEE